jgi:hypothetical protein
MVRREGIEPTLRPVIYRKDVISIPCIQCDGA